MPVTEKCFVSVQQLNVRFAMLFLQQSNEQMFEWFCYMLKISFSEKPVVMCRF